MTEYNMIGHVQEKRSKYDLLTVVMICTAEDTSKIENPLLKLLSLIFNQGHDVKELEDKLHADYSINVTPDLKERMDDMCNLSYGVDQRGYNRGFNDGIDKGNIQRGEQFANEMFTDNEPIDKIIRYSGLTSEHVHEIGVAGGFIKD